MPPFCLLLGLAGVCMTQAADVCEAGACADEVSEENTLVQLGQNQKVEIVQQSRTPKVETVLQGAKQKVSSPGGPKCSTISYMAKNVLPANAKAANMDPPMQVATSSNMDSKLKTLGIDFQGIWWMRGNPVPEELVSFAGTTVTSSTYPTTLNVPNNGQGMWAWNDNVAGASLQKYYAVYSPTSTVAFDFESATKGNIQTGLTDVPLVWVDEFPFEYMNDDEWNRPTIFQTRSVLPDTNYTLTRIVMADGSPHPQYWKAFMDSTISKPWFGDGVPGEAYLRSMSTDNACMRKCQIASPCFVCQPICG